MRHVKFWTAAHSYILASDGGTADDARSASKIALWRALDNATPDLMAMGSDLMARNRGMSSVADKNTFFGLSLKCKLQTRKQCACKQVYHCSKKCQDGDWYGHNRVGVQDCPGHQ